MSALPDSAVRTHDVMPDADLLLRETNHRCSNDLQMVVSLLALESRRTINTEVRDALANAMERVGVLARSRAALSHQVQHSLGAAFLQVCEALHAQCEPRSILVSLELATEARALRASQITTLALAVNELATNAIKHAFAADMAGHIEIKAFDSDDGTLVVTVDDDGLPFSRLESRSSGLGLDLVRRLVASVGGVFAAPIDGTKRFEITVPTARGYRPTEE